MMLLEQTIWAKLREDCQTDDLIFCITMLDDLAIFKYKTSLIYSVKLYSLKNVPNLITFMWQVLCLPQNL